ncbi:MAG: glutaredoxin family protein [Candidatus Bipolaricaulis sp.]|nr:glutaredoxin family protein [Candidatus Bipolaricaulis sp.]
MEARGSVSGRVACSHRTRFYGLSTCVWCRKARQLLEELGVPFEYVYVDLLTGQERDSVVGELTRLGLGETFPTLVIDGRTCIVGFKPDEIRRTLLP